MVQQVLLYSGGMDSYITAHAYPTARLLYLDTGAQYARKELSYLAGVGNRRVVIDPRLDLRDRERDDLIVPARNLLLVTLATYYGTEILLGATAGDSSTDKDQKFADDASALLTHIYNSHHFPGYGEVKVLLPFKDKTKAQMVAWYLDAKQDPVKLANTVSCYHPVHKHCGRCKACIRKWVALKVHGLHTLTPWTLDPAGYDWVPILKQIDSPQGWRCKQEDLETVWALRSRTP